MSMSKGAAGRIPAKGKVFLVGAGPGDAGLLTLKGKEVLERAEAVVYDSLVGEGIFKFIPKEAEMIDAGKRAGRHKMTQEEISRTLLEKAQEGKRVVRLKGGDPFLFGRGGEEMQLLAEHNIPFEVVPGVTSALAVPAYSGIPATHREFASSVHILTGHKKQGEPLRLDFASLSRLSGTLIFLMGASALEEICRGLLLAGMDPKTPAAVLKQGTCAAQKKVISNLAVLAKEAERLGVNRPAILMVGKVCALGGRFSWYEKLPLFGKKILVTRPLERSGDLAGRLRELGAEVLELAAIRTERITGNRRLWQEFGRLAEYRFLVFTSPAGADIFFEELKERGQDIRVLGTAQLAAIGPGTAERVCARGLNCAYMPEVYDGRHLGILLGQICRDGDRILIPRAAQGNPELIQEIKKRADAEITDLPIYRTVYEEFPERINVKKQIEAGQIHMAVFTSASTVRGFAKNTKGLDYGLVLAVCIGSQTEAAARELGMRTAAAREATVDSLAEACCYLSP